MKNIYKNTFKTILLAAASFIALPAQAQLGDVGEILRAGKADANILAGEFLKPFGQGFGAGLNSGWVMGAHTHKFLGFDVALRVGLAQVPVEDQSFLTDPATLGLSSQISLKAGSPSSTATLSGSDVDATATYEINKNGYNLGEIVMPSGVGQPYVPAVMVQAGIGLFFNTDVTVRYMPETEIPDFGSISLQGASVKHGLNQWLPIYLPVDLAVQAGFTSLNMTAPLSARPLNAGPGTDTKDNFPASTWEGQSLDFSASGYTVNVLVGKEIDLFILGINLYGGIGIEKSKTTISTPGLYPIVVPNVKADGVTPETDAITPPYYTKRVETIDSPLNLEFEGVNNMRFTAGAKVRLFLVNVVAEYTVAKYPMASIGVAISIR